MLVKLFREQPTSELARSASAGITSTLSPNERLQTFFHPWTSYLIVPLFALANAGIELDRSFLRTAYTAPITLGVLIGYVIGKPVALRADIAGDDAAEPRPDPTAGRLGGGAGQRNHRRYRLHRGAADSRPRVLRHRAGRGEARCAVRGGGLVPADRIVYRLTALLSPARRARALLGDVRLIQDLIPEVDSERDHIRGPLDASITVIEFGDFECPYCGQAESVARELLVDTDLRFVWRHLPLTDVHPAAQLAAEACRSRSRPGQVLGDARPADGAPG